MIQFDNKLAHLIDEKIFDTCIKRVKLHLNTLMKFYGQFFSLFIDQSMKTNNHQTHFLSYKKWLFTEAASCAIVTFLEMDSSETTGNGWMLLTALNLLSCGNQALIDCMTAASLPSTLVKCLYLFFDLPEIEDPDKCNPNSEFTAEERRALLQKIWVQVCSFMLFLLYSVHY